jgi:hypothetical protein
MNSEHSEPRFISLQIASQPFTADIFMSSVSPSKIQTGTTPDWVRRAQTYGEDDPRLSPLLDVLRDQEIEIEVRETAEGGENMNSSQLYMNYPFCLFSELSFWSSLTNMWRCTASLYHDFLP